MTINVPVSLRKLKLDFHSFQGGNITVTNGRNYIREDQENKQSITLDETLWYQLDSSGRSINNRHVSKRDFMMLLYDLKRILIRATHHTAQDNVM